MVTAAPTPPPAGVNDVIVGVGEAVTVKLAALVATPPGVVTAIVPVTPPNGTDAVICVAEFTVNVAVTPPNLTAVAPMKFVPVIVTAVPTAPLLGVNEPIVGTGEAVTVKLAALVAVPPGVVTVITPDVAPAGTVAVI
jgi:hypothetical protein